MKTSAWKTRLGSAHRGSVRRCALLAAIALAAALAALCLAACSSDGGGGSGATSGQFTGRDARDIAEFTTYVDEARELVKALDAEYAKDEEAELARTTADEFTQANEQYAAGDYAKAEELYESITKAYQRHFGANVNIVLAKLQQGKNEEALVQALACRLMYPDDGGVLLNVQTAAVACGFPLSLVDEALNDVHLEDGDTSVSMAIGNSNVDKEYEYNKVWDAIEVDLKDAAASAAAGESIDASELRSLLERTWLLAEDSPGDADTAALRAYLSAVAKQLGYSIDPDGSLEEAMIALETQPGEADAGPTLDSADLSFKEGTATSNVVPFPVADTELFELKITEIEQIASGTSVEYELSNKSSADFHLSIEAGEGWTVNGKDVAGSTPEVPVADPGKTVTGQIVLSGGSASAKDGVTSFSGQILVKTDGEGADGKGGLGKYSLRYDG